MADSASKVADLIVRQAEASAGNLKRGGADPHLVDICMGHFAGIARKVAVLSAAPSGDGGASHPPGLSVEEVARIAWEAGRAWSLEMGEEDYGPWPPTAGQFGWQEDDSEACREAERHKAQAILAAMEPRRADLIDIEQGRADP